MHKRSIFHFFSSLQDFLPREYQQGRVTYSYEGNPSVKDAIEALGIPHPEVALIRKGPENPGFDYQLKGGEELEVLPHNDPRLDSQKPLVPLIPPGGPRFIADIHLGRLARYLRVAGFDTVYENEDMGDERIAAVAAGEERIVLTRDVGLLKRSVISYGYILRNIHPRKQFKEVVHRYGLKTLFQPFGRCVHCNGLIESIEKEKVDAGLPPGIRRDFEHFYICSLCSHVYWEGSHYKRIKEMLETV